MARKKKLFLKNIKRKAPSQPYSRLGIFNLRDSTAYSVTGAEFELKERKKIVQPMRQQVAQQVGYSKNVS